MTISPTRPWRTALLLGLVATMALSACSALGLEAESGRGPGGGTGNSGQGDGASGGGGADAVPGEPGPGGDPDDVVSSEPDPGDPADPPAPADPGDPGAPHPGDGATHVEPVPGIVDSRPHAIDRVSVAADGRTVTVYWWGGVETCYGLDEVRVGRADDGTHTFTVLEGALPDLGDVACIDIALSKATTITLDEPLFRDGSQD